MKTLQISKFSIFIISIVVFAIVVFAVIAYNSPSNITNVIHVQNSNFTVSYSISGGTL